MAGGQHGMPGTAAPGVQSEKNAYSDDRPMNVQPTVQGGVAVGGQSDLPEGKA
ncbi:uncharacterized protein LAESUDRAFT_727286 [Laetiporus sulphureus 93-53]|uniref:Uncharacterized protein n=1 Tax=Laetiporus sulphureus 93-53 TaxID=1314785 RepID=A0A165DJR1_9APHY|nr:uncharacterized protein LAESUDRAFT_727286 [Laetiporus sulphureus 93-53]KZT05035.1 hypothetical protein LAESUDRAFT_727286 [Laetiporus sulphureus 93-53]